jgi:molybdopterin converting factor small subunit
MIQILFFGPVAERIGQRRIEMAFHPGLRWRDIRDELRARHREAFALVSIVAIDGQRIDIDEQDDAPLADGAEIVFMSAFSGG